MLCVTSVVCLTFNQFMYHVVEWSWKVSGVTDIVVTMDQVFVDREKLIETHCLLKNSNEIPTDSSPKEQTAPQTRFTFR